MNDDDIFHIADQTTAPLAINTNLPPILHRLDMASESSKIAIFGHQFLPCSYRIFLPLASRGPSADVYY